MQSKNQTVRLNSIESLRGVAALMIVFYHLVELAQLPLPQELGVIRSHFGLGVPLFYALSGFVLAFGYADKLGGDPNSMRSFYIGRFFRIAPLFYVVLIGWRLLGWVLWGWPVQSQSVFLNLTFLFGLVPGEHESLVMAGWSIGVEMLFYFIFPILIIFLKNTVSVAIFYIASLILSAAVSNALTASGLTSYAYMNLVTQLPFFTAGILVFRVWQADDYRKNSFSWLLLFLAIVFAAFLVVSPSLYQQLWGLKFGALQRNIWSLIFACFIYAACTVDLPFLQKGLFNWTGRTSFSIYLLHPIVMVAMIKGGLITWFAEFGVWYGFLGGSFFTCACLAVLAYFTHRFIEMPGISLGKKLQTSSSQHLVEKKSPSILTDQQGGLLKQTVFSKLYNPKLKRMLIGLDNLRFWNVSLYILAFLAFCFAGYFALSTIHQPLVDSYAFRQTQTAVTSLWMLKEPWNLAYQTPTMGFPWSVPFEFPIYQGLVALIVFVTHFELVESGRFLSYVFLIACAWPIFAISRRLSISIRVPLIFCILLWTSPLYVYWGRAFMIETAALFFAMACIPFAIDIGRNQGGRRSVFLFLLMATLGILQKVTTAGPVLLFIFIALIGHEIHIGPLNFDVLKVLVKKSFIIILPVIIVLAWTKYSDAVKMENPLGRQLTSKALTLWNFGSLEQRTDLHIWKEVIWRRGFVWNAGGILGLLLLVLPWLSGANNRRIAWLCIFSLMLYLLPVLIFFNLHIVHEYYQVGCTAFFIAALSLMLGGSKIRYLTKLNCFGPLMALVIVMFNISSFEGYYKIVAERSVNESDQRSAQAFNVGKFLKAHTPEDSAIAIFSQSYSSEIGFHSERKSISTPPWFTEYKELWAHPENYLGGMKLSAIAICPVTENFPTVRDIDEKNRDLRWNRQIVFGCEVLMPDPKQVVPL